jgi:glycosyltransferase involved in cell wall biosynthesis
VKKQILISVVIPAFNEERNIGQCLAALKNQNFPRQNYEIIVVDNNSTDKTAQIARKMGAKVIPEKTQGYVFALRKGCSAAKGEIITITDADTLVPFDWLKKIYQAYQKNPQVVCVGGRVILEPKVPLAVLVELLFGLGGWIFKLFSGSNLSIKRNVYQKIGGFREEVNFDTDVDLCLRARKEGKMLFLRDNPVVTSSRHFRGIGGVVYCLKGGINIISLVLFEKAPFFQFSDVREG